MKNLLISVSGGRSSALMAYIISTSEKYKNYNKLYLFANTGLEEEETLIFVRDLAVKLNIKIHWIEAVAPMVFGKGIQAMTTNYNKASRYGQPFKAVIDKYNLIESKGLPNLNAPYCSSRLKSTPINKFSIEYFKSQEYITALGLRREDMPKRISWAEVKASEDKIFPLITDFEAPLTQLQVHRMLIDKVGIDLGIESSKGNCFGCWKFSQKKTIKNFRESGIKGRFQWYIDLEEKYKDSENGSKMYRNNVSILDLIEKAKLPTTLGLFDDDGESCFCGV